ncbi:MAG: hypothetical protein D6729_16610, partial [Deltaproteobacteria bacterium]
MAGREVLRTRRGALRCAESGPWAGCVWNAAKGRQQGGWFVNLDSGEIHPLRLEGWSAGRRIVGTPAWEDGALVILFRGEDGSLSSRALSPPEPPGAPAVWWWSDGGVTGPLGLTLDDGTVWLGADLPLSTHDGSPATPPLPGQAARAPERGHPPVTPPQTGLRLLDYWGDCRLALARGAPALRGGLRHALGRGELPTAGQASAAWVGCIRSKGSLAWVVLFPPGVRISDLVHDATHLCVSGLAEHPTRFDFAGVQEVVGGPFAGCFRREALERAPPAQTSQPAA